MRTSSVLAASILTATLALSGCGGADRAPPESESAPEASAHGPYLLVVNKSGNTLSVMDPETGSEIKAIPTGFAPHEVAASPDGRFAYVTDYGTGPQPGNTVTVVDLGTMEVARTISLAPHTRPHGIGVAADGTVWVTTEGSAHVLHLDPTTGTILQAVETGQQTTHQLVIADGADRVVTANIGSGSASVVQASAGEVLAHVQTGAGAEGIDLHPDGGRVYVTNREAGTLSEIDLATNQVTRTLEVGEFPIRIRIRPDGREALVSNANANEVAVVDLDGWTVIRRIPVGAMPVGILLPPGDSLAYVANTQDDKVTVIDLERWTVAGEVVAGDEPDGMAWAVR